MKLHTTERDSKQVKVFVPRCDGTIAQFPVPEMPMSAGNGSDTDGR